MLNMVDFYGYLSDSEIRMVGKLIKKFGLRSRTDGDFVQVFGVNRYSDAAEELRKTALHQDETEIENWRG